MLSISSSLDYETAHGYFILVKAVDGGTPPLTSEVGVNVTITDANDNAPAFSQQSYNAIIREDALVGDKIIQVYNYNCHLILFNIFPIQIKLL